MTTKPTRPTKPEVDQAEKDLGVLWEHLGREFRFDALMPAYEKLHERSPLGYKLLMIAESIHYKELEAIGITPPRARSLLPNFDQQFIQNAPRICKSLCEGMRSALDALEEQPA